MKSAFVKKAKAFLPNWIGFIVLFAAYFFVTAPFFHHGFFPTADDFSVTRIDVMQQELKSLQFPVRYVQEFGNNGGYFLFNFYSPFIYYLGSLYHFLGLTLVKSTKFVFLTSYFVAMVGMYVLLRKYISKTVSVIGSILFITATYLNFDVYFRGALAEFFAMSLLPWVFWGFLRVKDEPIVKNTIIAGGLYTLLIITHNLTAFLFSFVLLLLFFFPPTSKKIFFHFAASVAIGMGISAFFWIPNLFEMGYTSYNSTWFATQSYLGNFINPLQFFGLQKIPWGFEPPFLGIGLFLGICFSAVMLFFQKQEKVLTKIGWFALISFIIATIGMWSITKPLWDHSSFLKDIQFPWRIMSPATVLAVFATAIALEKTKKVWLQIVIGILILLPAIILQYRYLRPSGYNYIAVYKAEDECSTTTWAHELLPKWVSVCLPKNNHVPIVSAVHATVTIANVQVSQNGRKITFETQGNGQIEVLRYYFPAWSVFIDGKKTKTYPYGKYGLLSFAVSPGKHQIIVSLTGTFLEIVANSISLVTLVGVIICSLTLVL